MHSWLWQDLVQSSFFFFACLVCTGEHKSQTNVITSVASGFHYEPRDLPQRMAWPLRTSSVQDATAMWFPSHLLTPQPSSPLSSQQIVALIKQQLFWPPGGSLQLIPVICGCYKQTRKPAAHASTVIRSAACLKEQTASISAALFTLSYKNIFIVNNKTSNEGGKWL